MYRVFRPTFSEVLLNLAATQSARCRPLMDATALGAVQDVVEMLRQIVRRGARALHAKLLAFELLHDVTRRAGALRQIEDGRSEGDEFDSAANDRSPRRHVGA